MSTLHDQAMTHIYQQVLQRLLECLTQGQRASLQLLIQRMLVAAGGIERIGDFKVMLAHGGGKDSSFALAFLRAAQLSIAARAPATFELRVVTARHVGMSTAVIENIERGYSALVLHDDLRVELLVLDDGGLQHFDALKPLSPRQQQVERFDTLVAGHLTAGQVRPMFCNRFYLALAELYRQGMGWEGGVDALINADPMPERKRYLAWGRRMMREAGLSSARPAHSHPGALLQGLGQLRRIYLNEVLGLPAEPLRQVPGPRRIPRFIDIADLLQDSQQGQSVLLLEFLRFRYDELALGFSQSACANPLLMAHLAGLRAQWVQGQDYALGIAEHLQQVKAQLRRKPVPAALQALAMETWQDRERHGQRRRLADDFALQGYNLNEEQLACLLFAPFVDRGRNLERFVQARHPGMQAALPYLHKALKGVPSPQPMVQWLEDISGLPLSTLQMLYQRESEAATGGRSLLARARDSDPGRLRH
ncbi:hypothetical protein AO392_12880 [Pseudomonas putida]|nr:hypothetical protein AO392_12880 [Pseudomonas putida]OOV94370.1 hypothetical protein MF6396_24010 [Pseudomonas sp. MF6396]